MKDLALVAFILVTILCLPASILIHELGHALTGRMFGFRLVEFHAGIFSLLKVNGAWKLSFNLRGFLFGKRYAAFDMSGQSQSKLKVLLVVLAGPLMSLFTALLFYYLMLYFNSLILEDFRWKIPAAVARLYMSINLLNFGLTLLPVVNPWTKRRTDGSMLLALLRNDQGVRRDWNISG